MGKSKESRVTIIPAEIESSPEAAESKLLRVAAYCRVSTNSDEQLSSYEAQLEYYMMKVMQNPQWSLVKVYADQGITGTSTKKRKAFQQMIRACQAGKIDLIITKSVSRFCRNTLDGLEYVRELKGMGVGVYFERENVNTLHMDNEMVLTFMMSQAQAESESLSGNIKWGHRKNFKDGKVYYHYKNFLGYRKGPNGEPEIDPVEAEVVKRIFNRYLLGDSATKIQKDLQADGIKTARGQENWNERVIRAMLRNEKYIGDALLQKTFVSDLFTRKTEKNTGQLPQYYVHGCHPAIIERDLFYRVQEEMARRASIPKRSQNTKTFLAKYSSKYALSEKVFCGKCRGIYRRISWRRPEGVKVVWRCLTRMELGKKTCAAPTVTEDVIQRAVVDTINGSIDKAAFTKALMDAAGNADKPDAATARLLELLNEQWPPMTEYDDEIPRHLLKRVVVKSEESVEVLLYGGD